MINHGSDEGDILVLTDEEGNMYAIPRQVVEQHRLTEAQKAEITSELGDDVSGYSMYQQFMNQQMAAQHQAESRYAAAEARMARQAQDEEDASTADQSEEVARSAGLRGIVTGVWRSLPFTKPASSNV